MTSRIPEGLLPEEPARWSLLAAAATALGVSIGFAPVGLLLLLGVLAVAAVVGHHRTSFIVIGVFVALGMVSGASADARRTTTAAAGVPEGTFDVVFDLVEDTTSNRYGVAVGEPLSVEGRAWRGPRLAVVGVDDSLDAGATVIARGSLRSGTRRVRDEIVAGTFTIASVLSVEPNRNPAFVVGNALRRRVQATFGGDRRTDGLITGLLIGDTRRLGAVDLENLRRSGLAHFVAVSGSNVAVFMVAWWVVTAPLSIHPRLRAGVGGVGLAIFVVVTRWEPSVIRASVMTAVPLVGALVGVPVDPWMALGVAVTTLLLVSGDLLGSVGFQLSALATAGVLVGVSLSRGRRPRWLWMPLMITVCAQLAVAPIILAVFGSVPLLAPVANLIVAPLVTAATVLGGLTLVVGALDPLASAAAGLVLAIADAASDGPQLGVLGVVAAVGIGSLAAVRVTRPMGIAVALIAALVFAGQASPWPSAPTLVALDVGQGDAILLQDPSGRAMLIDGGPDAGTLDRALRRHSVSTLDVVVATHGDADHVAGLAELLRSYEVGELWVSSFAATSELLGDVLDAAGSLGVPIVEVRAGVHATLGSIRIEVVGPQRRYASDNDGSVAIMASSGRSALIPGDIETVAQGELPPLRPDILIVPHHGSASSDPAWLEETVGSVAVLSYGTNRYGHPSPDIVGALEAAAVDIRRTFVEGDVVVSLAQPP
jgi:competence protein ComEC